MRKLDCRSVMDGKGRLKIDIDRWSIAAERDHLALAISEHGPDKLLETFRDVERLGTLYWSDGFDYAVKVRVRSGWMAAAR
jgi:hypothetical protein